MENAVSVEDLVARALEGEQAAYDQIYERFKSMAFNYAYSLLGDFEKAEDARQEAFVKAYCDLLSLKTPAAFPGWFQKIIHSHSYRLVRGKSVVTVPIEDMHHLQSNDLSPRRLAEQSETREQIKQALKVLPKSEREIIELYYFDQLTLVEISERLSVPAKTVKSRIHRARGRLKPRLLELAKMTVKHKNQEGDDTASKAATREAIREFDRELKAMQKRPIDQDPARACDLLCAKGRLLRFMGRADEALECFDDSLKIKELKTEKFKVRLQAEVGLTLLHLSNFKEAIAHLSQAAKTVYRYKDQDWLRASIVNGLGTCTMSTGDFPKARIHYQKTFELSKKSKSVPLEAEALNNLGLLDWRSGNLKKAISRFRESLQRWKKIKNRFGQALTLMNIGVLEENMGRLKPALRHYKEALATAQEIHYRLVESAAHCNLGNLHLNAEKWIPALDSSTQAQVIARDIGDKRSEAIARENKSLALVGLKQYADAKKELAAARKLATAIEDPERQLSLYLVEVELQLEQQKTASLANKLSASLEIINDKGFFAELPRCLRLQASLAIQLNKKSEAKKQLVEALAECQKQQNRTEEKKIMTLQQSLEKQ